MRLFHCNANKQAEAPYLQTCTSTCAAAAATVAAVAEEPAGCMASTKSICGGVAAISCNTPNH